MEKVRHDRRLNLGLLASRSIYESMSILIMERPKLPSLT